MLHNSAKENTGLNNEHLAAMYVQLARVPVQPFYAATYQDLPVLIHIVLHTDKTKEADIMNTIFLNPLSVYAYMII